MPRKPQRYIYKERYYTVKQLAEIEGVSFVAMYTRLKKHPFEKVMGEAWRQHCKGQRNAKCRICGQPSVPGYVFCEPHLIANRERLDGLD